MKTKKITSCGSSFSSWPARLVFLAPGGEKAAPPVEQAEQPATAPRTAAEKIADLKAGVKKAETEVSNLKDKIAKNPDKDFKKFLQDKGIDMDAKMKEITDKLAQIKTGMEIPDASARNAAVLVEVNTALAPLEENVDAAVEGETVVWNYNNYAPGGSDVPEGAGPKNVVEGRPTKAVGGVDATPFEEAKVDLKVIVKLSKVAEKFSKLLKEGKIVSNFTSLQTKENQDQILNIVKEIDQAEPKIKDGPELAKLKENLAKFDTSLVYGPQGALNILLAFHRANVIADGSKDAANYSYEIHFSEKANSPTDRFSEIRQAKTKVDARTITNPSASTVVQAAPTTVQAAPVAQPAPTSVQATPMAAQLAPTIQSAPSVRATPSVTRPEVKKTDEDVKAGMLTEIAGKQVGDYKLVQPASNNSPLHLNISDKDNQQVGNVVPEISDGKAVLKVTLFTGSGPTYADTQITIEPKDIQNTLTNIPGDIAELRDRSVEKGQKTVQSANEMSYKLIEAATAFQKLVDNSKIEAKDGKGDVAGFKKAVADKLQQYHKDAGVAGAIKSPTEALAFVESHNSNKKPDEVAKDDLNSLGVTYNVLISPANANSAQSEQDSIDKESARIQQEFLKKQTVIKDKLVKIDTPTYRVDQNGNSLTSFNIKAKNGDKPVGHIDVNPVMNPVTLTVKLIGSAPTGGEPLKTFSSSNVSPDNLENILKEYMPKHLQALGLSEGTKVVNAAESQPKPGTYEELVNPYDRPIIDAMLKIMDPIKPEDLGIQWVDENTGAAMKKILGSKFVEAVYVVKGAKFPDDIADIMSPKAKSLDKDSRGYEMRALLAKRQAELQNRLS